MSQVKTLIKAKTIPFNSKGIKSSNGEKYDQLNADNSAKKVSIIIPAFNEGLAVREGIIELRETLALTDIVAEIIVVDDGSKDNTAQEAKAAGARVIQHRSNRGYGASLKTGIIAASYDVIAITDADGTYPAKYLPEMIDEIENTDMVVGSRTGADVNIPLSRKPAKWFLRVMANYVSNTKIPDLNSGLRVFRRDVAMQYFAILSDQFSFTTTITLAMLCDKYAVSYLPIDYRKRQGKSKIMPWDAGSFAVLIMRVAMLFRPLRVFFPLVLICLAYGFIKTIIDLTHDPMISASAILALICAMQLTLVGMLGEAIAIRLGRFSPHSTYGIRPKDAFEFVEETDNVEVIKEFPEELPPTKTTVLTVIKS